MTSKFSPKMLESLHGLHRPLSDAEGSVGVRPNHWVNVNTTVALRTRGAVCAVDSRHIGLTPLGAEAIGVDYDTMIAQAHEQALIDNANFRRCPFADEGCDFTTFGRPGTPFGHHREITSDDQILYHVNQAHMPMSKAVYLGHIGMLDDQVRRTIRAWIDAEVAIRAAAKADTRITDVDQARAEAHYEYIERAKQPGAGPVGIMDNLDLAILEQRQADETASEARERRERLAERDHEEQVHAGDPCDCTADEWDGNPDSLPDPDGTNTLPVPMPQAPRKPVVDFPVRPSHCEKTDVHGMHVWSHLGPDPVYVCEGVEPERAVVVETPSFFPGAPPIRTYPDGSEEYGPYGPTDLSGLPDCTGAPDCPRHTSLQVAHDVVPFPKGTPEYARYEQELTAELDKFRRGEPPYGNGRPANQHVKHTMRIQAMSPTTGYVPADLVVENDPDPAVRVVTIAQRPADRPEMAGRQPLVMSLPEAEDAWHALGSAIAAARTHNRPEHTT